MILTTEAQRHGDSFNSGMRKMFSLVTTIVDLSGVWAEFRFLRASASPWWVLLKVSLEPELCYKNMFASNI